METTLYVITLGGNGILDDITVVSTKVLVLATINTHTAGQYASCEDPLFALGPYVDEEGCDVEPDEDYDLIRVMKVRLVDGVIVEQTMCGSLENL